MNKALVYSAGSFIIGAVAGALTLDRIWTRRFDREVDEVALEIKKDYARFYSGEDGKPPISAIAASKAEDVAAMVRDIKAQHPKKDSAPTDYTASYKGGTEEHPIMDLNAAQSLIQKASAQSEAIIDEMNYDGNRDIEKGKLEHHNVFEDHPVMPPDFDYRRDGGTYILTTDEFMEEPRTDGYDTKTVTWFEYDNTLIDEDDESIISIEDTIGNEALRHFGWNPKGDADTIFVRNEKTKIDFEVTRDERSYAEAIAGFIEEDEKRPRRKRPEDD